MIGYQLSVLLDEKCFIHYYMAKCMTWDVSITYHSHKFISHIFMRKLLTKPSSYQGYGIIIEKLWWYFTFIIRKTILYTLLYGKIHDMRCKHNLPFTLVHLPYPYAQTIDKAIFLSRLWNQLTTQVESKYTSPTLNK